MNRQELKNITPAPIWRAGSNTYYWWRNRGRHSLARTFSPTWGQNTVRLKTYYDRYAGDRCFIIGNGPSLRQTDLSLLHDEVTFGLNRIYLAFPELGFSTTYLVSVNELVLEQSAAEINELPMPKFITWRARRFFKPSSNLMFLDTDFTGPEDFAIDMTRRVFEGFTVTYMALQLAFYMGFSKAILIGVDHNFTTKGPPNTTITSQGDDPNHFSPNYFGKGFRWQLPDLDGSERSYTLARQAYASAGREVVDATVGGKLAIFPKMDYLSLFPSPADPA
jgi:hypothetical protein